jgi:hypothetical protein
LSKCRFYMIYWKFDAEGNGIQMSKEELQNPNLLLSEGDTGRMQQVDQLDLNDAFKTLGIYKTISGDQSDQIASMTKKSNDYARGILSVNISNFEAWTGLFTIWLGKMNSSLVATSLTKRECEKSNQKQSTHCLVNAVSIGQQVAQSFSERPGTEASSGDTYILNKASCTLYSSSNTSALQGPSKACCRSASIGTKL